MQSATPSLSRNESITARGLPDTTPSFRFRAAAARTASGAPGIGVTSRGCLDPVRQQLVGEHCRIAFDPGLRADDVGDVGPGAAPRFGVRQREAGDSVARDDRADRLVRVGFAVDEGAVEVE